MTKLNLSERKKRLEQRENKLKQLKASLNVQERKARTRKLIELGGLVSKAGLENWKSNTLFGALMFAKEKEKDSQQIEVWSYKGGAAFSKEKQKRSAVVVSFREAPSEEIRTQLKALGLKWNAIRQEWEGYVLIKELKTLLSEFKADIKELSGIRNDK